MVDYAKYQLVVPMEKASKLAAIHGVCQILGVLTVLPLSDYLNRQKTIILSNTTITVSLVGILVAGNSWQLLCVLVGSLAIFYSVSFPIYSACAGDYFQPELMGTTIGSWSIFYGLGAITTHWVTGILRDTKGVYDQAFLLNALMASIGIILISLVQKK
jgi:MFS family permease